MSCAVVCPSSSVYQPTNIIGYHCIELNVTTVPSKKCNGKDRYRYCNNIPENDGDCDNDGDCHGELICGSDNCEQASGAYAISDDCCMQGTAEAVAEKKKNKRPPRDLCFGDEKNRFTAKDELLSCTTSLKQPLNTQVKCTAQCPEHSICAWQPYTCDYIQTMYNNFYMNDCKPGNFDYNFYMNAKCCLFSEGFDACAELPSKHCPLGVDFRPNNVFFDYCMIPESEREANYADFFDELGEDYTKEDCENEGFIWEEYLCKDLKEDLKADLDPENIVHLEEEMKMYEMTKQQWCTGHVESKDVQEMCCTNSSSKMFSGSFALVHVVPLMLTLLLSFTAFRR